MFFDINSNSYFQNNQVLTQTKTIQEKNSATCNGKLKNTTSKCMNPKYSFKNHNDSSI